MKRPRTTLGSLFGQAAITGYNRYTMHEVPSERYHDASGKFALMHILEDAGWRVIKAVRFEWRP